MSKGRAADESLVAAILEDPDRLGRLAILKGFDIVEVEERGADWSGFYYEARDVVQNPDAHGACDRFDTLDDLVRFLLARPDRKWRQPAD